MTAKTLPDTTVTRQAMIDGCVWMNSAGINQGTSGNISVRVADGLLITPSAVAYADMTPEMIQKIPADGAPDLSGPLRPSTEWQFHQAILQARPDIAAVVHAHPTYATALATQRRTIPAVHYMVAIFGGADVPLADYALFGSTALSDHVTRALRDRTGCLMANHGAITLGDSLSRALWRMEELENLARVYTVACSTGDPVILSDEEIAEVLGAISNYGAK